MIAFQKFTLDNGLRVIVNPDSTTPLAAVNLMYNVGSRDEDPKKTGFAHLFEHLMFGGSKNIPDFDQAIQIVGGDNNAFTNNNVTNYYITLPKNNIETAFWLESDRMLSLAFSKKSLEVQRNVVIEEYKQRYLNQPYGDVWLLLRPLAYKVHPYQWATIGKEISHIENARLEDVKDFFFRHYAPNNAVLTVSGNVDPDYIYKLVKKWFGPIPYRQVPQRNIIAEPLQTEERRLCVERNVPFDVIYKAYHMKDRLHHDYYIADLLSDILSNGKSSRLYLKLVKEKNLFGEINAYITGDNDPGLFIISGKVHKGITIETAELAIEEEIKNIMEEYISEYELEKVKNKVESMMVLSEMNTLNKATNLAYFELLDTADRINFEIDCYRKADVKNIKHTAKELFDPRNCSTLWYKSIS